MIVEALTNCSAPEFTVLTLGAKRKVLAMSVHV